LIKEDFQTTVDTLKHAVTAVLLSARGMIQRLHCLHNVANESVPNIITNDTVKFFS